VNKNIFYWPIVCGPVVCKNRAFSDEPETEEPIVPETLGEAASLEKTTIEYLCLAAVYQLLEEKKLTPADIQAAYQRGETSSS
jgi:hypothetical protein